MIGIFSDAHGNTYGFLKAIRLIESLNVSKVYFLGDSVGYIPTIDALNYLIEHDDIECILGNHEEVIITDSYDDEKEKIYKHRLINNKLSKYQKTAIKKWPKYKTLEFGETKCLLVHGGVEDFTNQYMYPDDNFEDYILPFDYVIMGHTHYPFIRKCNNTVFVNVGSCGLPRDNGMYGSFVIIDPLRRDATIYRFNIMDTYYKLISELGDNIHNSVQKLFFRRNSKPNGTLINDE